MLFVITTINYADRATISIAAPGIRKELGLDAIQMGFVFSAFAWSYVLAQLPGGWLLDRFGSKITYFFSIFLWSVFTMLPGTAGFFAGGAAVFMLFALRLLVGAAEAPSFPGNSRIASSWFPTNERGLAAAIFNSAQYFATVLFAPIMGWLVHSYGWHSVFFFFSIFLWSVFTMLTGTAGFFAGGAAVFMLFALRLLVGAAEAPSFPGNSRIASSWFPTNERGLAAAIFNSAQYFATVLFAPIMGWLVHSYGWHSVFFVMGGLGIVMAFVWLKVIYGPKDHPSVSQSELKYIQDGGALVDLDGASKAPAQVNTFAAIKELLGNRMLLGVYIGQYAITTLTYFFLTWFPVYLVQERHMTILKAGFVASVPAIAGFLGGVAGGWLSDRLAKRGYSLSVSRKVPIVLGMLMSMSMIACNYIETDMLVVAVMSLAFFGKGVGALGWAVVSDTSPKEAGGLSGALFNTFGNTAGITTPIVIGYIVQATGSFSGALVFVGANAALAIACYLFIVGDIKRFSLSKSLIAK
ncbi:MFS transporter [Massilia sp. WF1]|uniref:MFS transporter n=1 Tax=Massilia sp. WF1 TaxID=1406431 RepID=UPI000A023243